MAAYCSSVAFLSCRPSLFAFHVLADPAPSVLCPSVCVRTVSRHKSALSYLDFFFIYLFTWIAVKLAVSSLSLPSIQPGSQYLVAVSVTFAGKAVLCVLFVCT